MKSMKTFSILFLAALIAMPLLCTAENYPYNGKVSVYVSYANASTNADLEASPMINLSFDGSTTPIQITMDTGSCGIVVSEDIFQPAPGL